MRADAEALDRQRAQTEVAALLEQLGPAVDVHALAVGELEPQRVELPARHLSRREHEPSAGSLSVKKTLAQRVVPPQLRHLALDPDGRQPAEPLRDAAVERSRRSRPSGRRTGAASTFATPAAYRARERYSRISAAVACAQPWPTSSTRDMQVGLAGGEPLGDAERVARLDQHVEPPALDLRALALSGSSTSVVSLMAPQVRARLRRTLHRFVGAAEVLTASVTGSGRRRRRRCAGRVPAGAPR